MKIRIATAFAAGFVAAVLLGFLRPTFRPVCQTGDMTIGLGSQRTKELEEISGAWIHNARECRIGDYVIDAPDKRGHARRASFAPRAVSPRVEERDDPL